MPTRARRSAPRYREILTVLRERISSGRYPLDTYLPSESELTQEFSASRFTVREALRRLQADGMLERSQGAGSKVVRTYTGGVFVQTYEFIDQIVQFAHATEFQLLGMQSVTLSADLAAALIGEEGEVWTLMRGLRHAPGVQERPLSLIESYIPPRFAAHMEALAASKPPFYAQLAEAEGESVDSLLQEVQAVVMPARVARQLEVPPGTVSLRLLRRYEGTNGTIIGSFNWHLGGDHFVYRSRLTPRPDV